MSARLGGVHHDWAEFNTEAAITASALQGCTELFATRKSAQFDDIISSAVVSKVELFNTASLRCGMHGNVFRFVGHNSSGKTQEDPESVSDDADTNGYLMSSSHFREYFNSLLGHLCKGS
jgi:hypothetical protein